MTEYLFERKPKKPVNRSEKLRNKPWRVYYDELSRKNLATFHNTKLGAVWRAFYAVHISRRAIRAELIDVKKERNQ